MPKDLLEPNQMLLDVCIVGNMRQNGLKPFFFFGTINFYLKNLILNFLGPEEMIKWLVQNLPK